MQLRTLVLAALAAATLVPAAASAQSYGYSYGYNRPDYRHDDDGRRGGDALMAREERLRDWMRRGSQEGWLNGWQAQRAWSEFRATREASANGGYGRRDAWRRLERLTDFVRRAHEEAGDD